MASDVLELELPSAVELALHAGGPLFGVGGMELDRHDDILRLGKEFRRGRRRDDGFGGMGLVVTWPTDHGLVKLIGPEVVVWVWLMAVA